MSDVLEGLDVVEEVPIEAPKEPVAAAPEPPKEPVAAPPKEERTVPLASHLEERNKWRSEIDEERKSRKALEERLAKLENPPQAPPPKPDFVEDPRGYVDHSVKAALEELNSVKAQVQETGKTAQQTQEEARFNAFMTQLGSTEMEFRQKTPDYQDALQHLRFARAAEIQLVNPAVTQEQLQKIIGQEEITLAAQLMQAGKNPHEVAYALAKARGYTKKEAAPAVVLPEVKTPAQLPPDQTLGTGAGSPAADQDEKFPDAEEAFDAAFKSVFKRRA